jgi:hypothetical protein
MKTSSLAKDVTLLLSALCNLQEAEVVCDVHFKAQWWA